MPTCCLAADFVSINAALFAASRLIERGAVFLGRGGQCVAGTDLARRGHFGIDAAIRMIEVFQQRARNREVADSSVRIDVGCRTARYPLDNSRPCGLSDGDRLIEKIKLEPGRPAGHINVAPEA